MTVGVTLPRWGPADEDPANGHNAFSLTEGHANLLTRCGACLPGCQLRSKHAGPPAAAPCPASACSMQHDQLQAVLYTVWPHCFPPRGTRSFRVAAPYHHDVSLSGSALLNVISAGSGADLNLDLHR